MVQARVLQIVRQFWENAIKLLLEDPKNVRDLLALCGADIVKQIDLRRLKLIQTTFVERDYRHVESDVVLLAPLRRRKGERTARVLMIYILIEHQSEPDRLMPLRSVDYVVQILRLSCKRTVRVAELAGDDRSFGPDGRTSPGGFRNAQNHCRHV